MASLKDRLQEALKSYMKARDKVGVSSVRMMLSAITLKEKEKGRSGELSEGDLVAVIASYQKKVEEALEGLRLAGRDTSEAEAELRVVKEFLPSRLTDEDITNLIEAKIGELQSAGQEVSFGQVMKAVMQEAKGRADGKVINELVRKRVSPQS